MWFMGKLRRSEVIRSPVNPLEKLRNRNDHDEDEGEGERERKREREREGREEHVTEEKVRKGMAVKQWRGE